MEYKARANNIWLRHDGLINPVIGTYDLTKVCVNLVVDIMRTHPMIIIGGILQDAPFFVPPDEFLRQLRESGAAPDELRRFSYPEDAMETQQIADEIKNLKTYSMI